MMKTTTLFNYYILLLLLFVLCYHVTAVTGDPSTSEDDTIYIGVLLPLTGPEGQPLYDALQYGVDQIQKAGGINGRPVRLVYRDTSTGDLRRYAEELTSDPRIDVVIGPYTSDELFEISDLFIKKQKVLVSPSASSDEIFRAFAGTGNIWRIRTNDRDITSVVMQHLSAHHVQSAALFSPNTSYGKTFYDWIPFWAIETGVNLTGCIEYSDPGEIPSKLSQLVATHPEYIIFVNSGSNKDIITALDTLKKENSTTSLYLIQPGVNEKGDVQKKSDADTLLDALVSGQWKLQNTSVISVPLPDDTLVFMSPAPDPEFAGEYTRFSGREPLYSVSEVYDALLISGAILSRFEANPSKSPMNAANTVLLNTSGIQIPRTVSGFQSAFEMIQNGEIPIITGATGALTFVPEGTDRLVPWYQTYRVADGSIIEDPIVYQSISKQVDEPGESEDAGIQEEKLSGQGDLWAVIGGLSENWNNYRHQADALTMYQLLKQRGVPDDHIILLIYDDIPYDPRNTRPGEVYHIPEKEEVRTMAVPDYTGSRVNKKTLENILTGTKSSPDNPILESDKNATVLMYFASHGSPEGRLLIGNGEESITPGEFSFIIDKMGQRHAFGRMLVILESCFSGTTAANVTTPNVLVMTASGKNETSKSATYYSELSSWISDEFTSKLTSILQQADEPMTIRDLYKQVYRAVPSSHPGIYNNNNSFSLGTPVSVFFR